MGLEVKLQVFEGPLDLLLHLIDKNKIDIYDIPIVEITNQYMDISEVSEVSSWMSSLKDVLIWWVGIAVLLHVCAALKEYEKEGESNGKPIAV